VKIDNLSDNAAKKHTLFGEGKEVIEGQNLGHFGGGNINLEGRRRVEQFCKRGEAESERKGCVPF